MRSVLEEVVAHLASSLDVPVSAEAPTVRPAAFVVVQPVGGSSAYPDLHSDYAVQAWARTYADSESLVRECCDAMLAYGATMMADPVPLGYDGTHRWWQASFTVHALW